MLLQVYESVEYKYFYIDGQSNSPSLIIQAGSFEIGSGQLTECHRL